MKTKTIIKLLFTAAAFAVLVSFAGCSLAATEVDETALDRRANPERGLQSNEFTATVVVTQVTADTMQNGSSNQFRTRDEILAGSVIYSEWPLLSGAAVLMDNFTNFSGNPDPNTGALLISGTNHSSIELTTTDGTVITMKARGAIEGLYPAYADIDMTWNTTGPGPNAMGSISGEFFWIGVDVPTGVFTITGTYTE